MSDDFTPDEPVQDDQPAEQAEPIARVYLAEFNPDGGYIAGVPLRDITTTEWAALPPHLQRSADALPFYAAPVAPEE